MFCSRLASIRRRLNFLGDRKTYLVVGFVSLALLVSLVFSKLNSTREQPVKNGGFDANFQHWTEVATNPVAVRNPNTPGSAPSAIFPQFNVTSKLDDTSNCMPQDRVGRSDPFVFINVPFGSDGYIEQEMWVPWSGGDLSFRSWGWEDYSFQFNLSGIVRATVSIVDSSSTEHVLSIFIPPPMLIAGNPDVCTGRFSVLLSFPLSDYAGQTVRVRLRATSLTSQECCGTLAIFDDVSISSPTLLQDFGAWIVIYRNELLAIIAAIVSLILLVWRRSRKSRRDGGQVIIFASPSPRFPSYL